MRENSTSFSRMIKDLRAAGLLDQAEIPHLTPKGREWLRALVDAETQEVTERGEQARDLPVMGGTALLVFSHGVTVRQRLGGSAAMIPQRPLASRARTFRSAS